MTKSLKQNLIILGIAGLILICIFYVLPILKVGAQTVLYKGIVFGTPSSSNPTFNCSPWVNDLGAFIQSSSSLTHINYQGNYSTQDAAIVASVNSLSNCLTTGGFTEMLNNTQFTSYTGRGCVGTNCCLALGYNTNGRYWIKSSLAGAYAPYSACGSSYSCSYSGVFQEYNFMSPNLSMKSVGPLHYSNATECPNVTSGYFQNFTTNVQIPMFQQKTISVCTTDSYTYSDWGACQPEGKRYETVINSPNCIDGVAPILNQDCTYSVVNNEVFLTAPVNNASFLTGYAWSDNMGWIKFGDLLGFPSTVGTTASDAKIVGNNIVGWARACIGTKFGDCSTMENTTTGDWNGWISFKGTGYGVSVDNDGNLSGYASGFDMIDFTGVKLSQAIVPQTVATSTIVNVIASPSVTVNFYITPSPITILSGASTTLYWSSTNADSCSFKKGEDAFNTGVTATSGSVTSGILNNTTSFSATCSNSDHSATKTTSLTVNVAPPCKGVTACNPTSWGEYGSCGLNGVKTRTCKEGGYSMTPAGCIGSVSAPIGITTLGCNGCSGPDCTCIGYDYEWTPETCPAEGYRTPVTPIKTHYIICPSENPPLEKQSCIPKSSPCTGYNYDNSSEVCEDGIIVKTIDSGIPNGCSGGVEPTLVDFCPVNGGSGTVGSYCIASQAQGPDINGKFLVNKNTKWTMRNPMGAVTVDKWNGTNVLNLIGNPLEKIYTTVGTKIITGTGEVNGETTYCHATTTMKVGPTSGGEI